MNAKMLTISLAVGVAAFAGRADDAVLQSDEMYPLEGGGVLHVFRQDGTLKVKSPGNISFVLVGGGGSGGDHRGGGGGAGGVVTNAEYYLNVGNYDIAIGTGAKQAFTEYVLDSTGETKTNRTFSVTEGVTKIAHEAITATATRFGDLFTAYPGGNGGGVRSGGSDGASGGGGGGFMETLISGGKAIYAEASNLGNVGGTTLYMKSPGATGAGGGGAGTPGEDRTNHVDNIYAMIGGHGGTGVVTRITGREFWIGGGGNAQGVGDVVPGGGGKGTTSTVADVNKGGNGAAYTGGGGGGSGSTGNAQGLGGDGGSGVALFRTEGDLPEMIFSQDVRATGGTITEKSRNGKRWCIHTFTEDGTFTLPEGTVVEMLLVGGGGAGGNSSGDQHAGGGGGGGRVVVSTNYIAAGSYEVVIGQGGVAANGTDSTFFGYCAKGGGKGGNVRNGGNAGGCSGGGSAWGTGDYSPGAVTAATNEWSSLGLPIDVTLETQYGCSGGTGRYYRGGGGGGAGAIGGDASNSKPGNGGDGFESDITGEVVCYGGGGGGGGVGSSTFWNNGGAGGGGSGGGTKSATNVDAQSYGLSGEDGLGGGGGGGGGGTNAAGSSVSGGKGGSGVVILRYRIQPTGLLISIR